MASLIPDPEPGSTLDTWAREGNRIEPIHSNVVSFVAPDERFTLQIEVDEPVAGYLIRLYQPDESAEGGRRRIACAVVDDQEAALKVAEATADRATELADPTLPAAAPELPDPELSSAVAAAFEDLETDDLTSTVAFRDERLVALLVGLERSGELTRILTDAQEALGRESDTDSATRSEAARLLLRVGLQALDEGLLEVGSTGYNRHLQQQADEF